MLEGLRTKVGLSYSRLHFRKHRDRMMNFTDALTRAHRALVIFPEFPDENESLQPLLRFLQRKFSSDSLMVLLRDKQLTALPPSPKMKTLAYCSDDINPWFLPRRRLVAKIRKNTFDVALDLNINLSLPGAFLCKASNAPLRVSFVKPGGDRFYNFQVKTAGSTNKTISYRNFLRCLDMF
jgi:hypothetical protein